VHLRRTAPPPPTFKPPRGGILKKHHAPKKSRPPPPATACASVHRTGPPASSAEDRAGNRRDDTAVSQSWHSVADSKRGTLRDLEESSSSDEEAEPGRQRHHDRADDKRGGGGAPAKMGFREEEGGGLVVSYRTSSPPPLPAESVSILSDGKGFLEGSQYQSQSQRGGAKAQAHRGGKELEADGSVMSSSSLMTSGLGGSQFSHQSDLYDFVGLTSSQASQQHPSLSTTHHPHGDGDGEDYSDCGRGSGGGSRGRESKSHRHRETKASSGGQQVRNACVVLSCVVLCWSLKRLAVWLSGWLSLLYSCLTKVFSVVGSVVVVGWFARLVGWW
jgi:hypothetical protein